MVILQSLVFPCTNTLKGIVKIYLENTKMLSFSGSPLQKTLWLHAPLCLCMCVSVRVCMSVHHNFWYTIFVCPNLFKVKTDQVHMV